MLSENFHTIFVHEASRNAGLAAINVNPAQLVQLVKTNTIYPEPLISENMIYENQQVHIYNFTQTAFVPSLLYNLINKGNFPKKEDKS